MWPNPPKAQAYDAVTCACSCMWPNPPKAKTYDAVTCACSGGSGGAGMRSLPGHIVAAHLAQQVPPLSRWLLLPSHTLRLRHVPHIHRVVRHRTHSRGRARPAGALFGQHSNTKKGAHLSSSIRIPRRTPLLQHSNTKAHTSPPAFKHQGAHLSSGATTPPLAGRRSSRRRTICTASCPWGSVQRRRWR